MLARTTWCRALALAIVTTVACDIQSRTSLSGNEPARLAVSPKLLILQQNQVADFTAIGFTTAGDTASLAVSWSATSGSIIDTSTNNGRHNGRYRAGADTGKVKVIVKGGGHADTAVVTVTLAPVVTVMVSPAAASVAIGRTVQLAATPQDVGGNPLAGRVVTWASTSPGVATVNSSGVVTGVAAGAATVTAACEGQSGTAAITVTVVPVASVAVSPAAASVTVGQAVQLTATPKDASGNPLTGRTVTWATSNAAVATVSGNGLVTAGTPGTATITASSEGQNGTAAITVTNVPVASVAVTPAPASVQVGQTVQLTATPKDASGSPLAGRVVTWASSASAIATVSASGLVTGVAAGSATLTATSEGKSGTAAVTVTIVPVASVAVSPASASVAVGQTVQLSATPKDASGNALAGRVVTWASTAPAVATVNGSGLVTGVAAGAATITATSEGQSGTGGLTVTASVTSPGAVTNLIAASVTTNSVTLSFTEVNDGTGQPASYDIRSAVAPLSWGSAASVAQGTCTVPVAGVAIAATRTCTVLGLAAGTSYQFQLVAFRGPLNGPGTVFGGLSNVASGTTGLSSAPVASVTVSPAAGSVAVGQVLQLTATPKDANGNSLSGRVVTWTSSNALLATVNASGLVTGLVLGTVTLTATSEGVPGTATVTVTVASAFALPDLLNNATFETGWEGFVNWGYGTPSPGTGTFSISRSQDVARDGGWSAKSTFGPNGSDANVQFAYPFGDHLDVYARVWFYIAGAVPNNHHKWIRFQTAGFNGVQGGLYLASSTGGITWCDAGSSPNSNVDIPLGIGIPTFNAWHSIEVEYDRTGWNTARGPRVRFWYDGAVAVGPTPPSSVTAYWGDDAGVPNGNGPWLYIGGPQGSARPSNILIFDDTINAGNSATGTFYYDRVAVSTQRIGP